MGAVAREAGVATGTAYVHYASKEELVYATYLEVKETMSTSVLPRVDIDASPRERFTQLWMAVYRHFEDDPSSARFLSQLEESPYYGEARRRLEQAGDPILEQASRPDLLELFADLPLEVVYAFSLGMAVRLVASGANLGDGEVEEVARASWRAITSSSEA